MKLLKKMGLQLNYILHILMLGDYKTTQLLRLELRILILNLYFEKTNLNLKVNIIIKLKKQTN